jgi:hypothetical protein
VTTAIIAFVGTLANERYQFGRCQAGFYREQFRREIRDLRRRHRGGGHLHLDAAENDTLHGLTVRMDQYVVSVTREVGLVTGVIDGPDNDEIGQAEGRRNDFFECVVGVVVPCDRDEENLRRALEGSV